MGIEAAIIGSGIVGAGASLLGAKNSSSAATESTQLQSDALRYGADLQYEGILKQVGMEEAALEFQKAMWGEQQATLGNAREVGTGYLNTGYGSALTNLQDYYNQSRGMLGNARSSINQGYSSAENRLEPLADLWAYDQAKGYLQNPDEINRLPGVEWQKEEGIKALQNAFSRTTGGGLTGNKIRAAEEFGQNYASTQLDTALNRLMPFVNIGVTTTGNLADMDINKGTALANLDVTEAGMIGNQGANLSNLNTNWGSSLANLELGSAGAQVAASQAMAPMISQSMSNIGSLYGAQGGIGANYANALGSLYGNNAINQANISNDLVSNLSGTLSGALNNYAAYQYLNEVPQNQTTYTNSLSSQNYSPYTFKSGYTGNYSLWE